MDNSAATNYNAGISWFVGLPQEAKTTRNKHTLNQIENSQIKRRLLGNYPNLIYPIVRIVVCCASLPNADSIELEKDINSQYDKA
jgi:hypothetical protein